MRRFNLPLLFTLLSTSTLTFSLALPSFLRPQIQPHSQSPIMPNADPSVQPTSSGSSVTISDVIAQSRAINIFAGFTRDISSVSTRLDTAGINTTVLAPLNSAITSLPRKPWEHPDDYAKASEAGTEAYAGQEGQDKAYENLRRFVEAHVVGDAPWEEGKKVKSVGGGEVWWQKDAEGRKKIMPGGIEVESVASKVANGEVWVLKGVLNYARS